MPALSKWLFPLTGLFIVVACFQMTPISGPHAQVGDVQGNYFVYVANELSSSISVFKMDALSGALTFVESTGTVGSPYPMTVSKSQDYLYVGTSTLVAGVRQNRIASYSIDPATGKLALGGNFDVDFWPVYLSLDRTDKILIACSAVEDAVAIYRLQQPGVPNVLTRQRLNSGNTTHACLPTPDNRYIQIPNRGVRNGLSQIQQFLFDATQFSFGESGASRAVDGEGPRHLVFHPSLSQAYVVNEFASNVVRYSLEPITGTLGSLQTLTSLPQGFTGANTGADIHITQNGKFLYASNRGHNSLAMYSLDATGEMALLGHVATETTPRDFAIDPTDRFVFVAGQGSGRLAAYSINQTTGRLDALATYPVGTNPDWVEVVRFK